MISPDLRRPWSKTMGSTSKKLLATIAVLGAAASIAGLGTYATFTSTTSQSHAISSGTVTIALGATGAATNRLNIGASALAPGDTIQRSVDLINSGSLDLASVTLTTTATAELAARHRRDQRPADGDRQVLGGLDRIGPPYTYTCGGTTTSVLASRAVIGNLALSNLGARPPVRPTVCA